MTKKALLLSLALLAICLLPVASASAYLYVPNDGRNGERQEDWANVVRYRLDGSNRESGFLAAKHAFAITVDKSYVYWVVLNEQRIGRAKLDGSNPEPNFITGIGKGFVFGLAVDRDHIYWTNRDSGKVGRADVDGGRVNPSFLDAGKGAKGIVSTGGQIFWARPGAIASANVDGGNLNPTLVGGVEGAFGIDVADGYVYWSARSGIGRAKTDGSDARRNFVDTDGKENFGLAVAGGRIYWTKEHGPIGAADVDGSNRNQSFIGDKFGSGALAADGLRPAAKSADSTGAGTSAAAPRKQPRAIRTLVAGRAEGPLMRAIKRGDLGPFAVDSSAEKTDRYELLVVDGDHLSPRKMERQIRGFAASGRWVLALDAGRAHFRRALHVATGFDGVERGDALLFRRTRKAGRPFVQMIAVPQVLPRGAGAWSSKRRFRATRQEARRLAGVVHRTLRTGGRVPAATASASASEGPPAELQHVTWSYTVVGSQYRPNGFWVPWRKYNEPIFDVPFAGGQTIDWSFTHTFDVYLDNGGGRPQGNRQIVTYSLDGEVTPKRPDEEFFQMYKPFWVGFNKSPGLNLERGWWTSAVGSDVDPDSATNAKLSWQASSPATPNEETEYTTGDEFEVGFSGSKEGAEIEGSYKITHEKTERIPDWGVESETAGNQLGWLFSSRRCDLRPTHYNENRCFDIGFSKSGTPNLPPDLSLGQFQIHTSGRWQTKGLLGPGAGELGFDVSTPITLGDINCGPWNVGDFGCTQREHRTEVVGPPTEDYSFDVGAVVPVPVEAVTLTPSPVNGAKAEAVTGTVTLARPAAMDTSLTIYSDSPNAVVGGPSGRGSQRTITIAKGSRTATFAVQTNDNGLAAGGHTTAAITVFYAEPTTVQLRVESPAG